MSGEKICSRAGIKKTLMELGGNGPEIVCADANLEEAAKAAAFGCFYNAGQVCCATERILVDRKVHDKFLEHLLREARGWKIEHPLAEDSYCMGPLNNEPTAVKTEEHLADAPQNVRYTRLPANVTSETFPETNRSNASGFAGTSKASPSTSRRVRSPRSPSSASSGPQRLAALAP